eukprot:TRINITY_DN2711_c0_g3_i2.p1 TRINITY_DN2711_c0_g3~~TRINITY_DN2711_c0_g3_i2.p1  ORF type:complete len:270 (+),score=38.69 TRINITY_DN2711_c0_g3_i2:104-913(+)
MRPAESAASVSTAGKLVSVRCRRPGGGGAAAALTPAPAPQDPAGPQATPGGASATAVVAHLLRRQAAEAAAADRPPPPPPARRTPPQPPQPQVRPAAPAQLPFSELAAAADAPWPSTPPAASAGRPCAYEDPLYCCCCQWPRGSLGSADPARRLTPERPLTFWDDFRSREMADTAALLSGLAAGLPLGALLPPEEWEQHAAGGHLAPAQYDAGAYPEQVAAAAAPRRESTAAEAASMPSPPAPPLPPGALRQPCSASSVSPRSSFCAKC